MKITDYGQFSRRVVKTNKLIVGGTFLHINKGNARKTEKEDK